MKQEIGQSYYKELIDLQDVEGVEAQIRSLLEIPIESISDLEMWLKSEKDLMNKITEAMTGHQVDFYRDYGWVNS
ncbi:hypothetical protein MXL46_04815 [Heyndrickxia sporothermodurans]|uniref:hypothetical protein n=1 Tax=Heyndrickxia sporothermodurans TaxID=46224 RepID=UPI002DBA2E06|nr:hypothetical protein [Heyndrickxia sporothermodurans]MEB6548432.1 hypothetical protein [Heyndrickxia sporothermodurans]